MIVAPEDPRALAAAVADFRNAAVELDSMAARNREYAERHFDRSVIVTAQQQVIERAIGNAAARRQGVAETVK